MSKGEAVNEADWLAATDPTPMLEFLRGKVSHRKLRLFGCGCCRQIWNRITEPALHGVVEVSERYADGKATVAQLRSAYRRARRVVTRLEGTEFYARTHYGSVAKGMMTPQGVESSTWNEDMTAAVHAARSADATTLKSVNFVTYAAQSARTAAELLGITAPDQAGLLRDGVGPRLFHRIAFASGWRTSTVIAIAQQMYESGDFSPMPILADALQDAGCDSPEIVSHCLGEGPHARGCWVTDLILGKE